MYTPYFYVIKHKASGMLYAGSRCARGCHPDELMKEFGYHTSSSIIHDIIKKEGFGAFEIVEVVTYKNAADAYDHETKFLKENRVRSNPSYFNKHENEFGISYTDEIYQQMMMDKYGYKNAFEVPLVKEKIKDTLQSRFGVDHPSKSTDIIQKKKDNFIKKYGVENPLQVNEIKEKAKKTCLERYGVDNIRKSSQYKEQTKKKNIELYGVENVSQNKEIKLKKAITSMKNYGVSNCSQSEEIKEKKKATSLKKYGVENWRQSDEGRRSTSERNVKMANREIVKKISNLKSEMKLKLKPGWYLKSDEILTELYLTMFNTKKYMDAGVKSINITVDLVNNPRTLL